jgi:pimeloyl-ACP methyl ester carboxylesterase
VIRSAVALLAAVAVASACQGETALPPIPPPVPEAGRADVGGYELAYACEGEGTPVVILEAGLGAAGTETFFSFVDRVAGTSRVCTYDRAGTGSSDERAEGVGRVTAGLMARELHALLEELGIEPPVVIAAHSYGGMPARAFATAYPDDVAGLVLIDVSSEPEVPVYERLHAGPWIDGEDRIDIHATVDELRAAADLGDLPVIVVTAEVIDDEWLATVPRLAARAQARLATLSTDGMQVVALGSKHFVHEDAPNVVATAVRAVVGAVRSASGLPTCAETFAGLEAVCVPSGSIPKLVPA